MFRFYKRMNSTSRFILFIIILRLLFRENLLWKCPSSFLKKSLSVGFICREVNKMTNYFVLASQWQFLKFSVENVGKTSVSLSRFGCRNIPVTKSKITNRYYYEWCVLTLFAKTERQICWPRFLFQMTKKFQQCCRCRSTFLLRYVWMQLVASLTLTDAAVAERTVCTTYIYFLDRPS